MSACIVLARVYTWRVCVRRAGVCGPLGPACAHALTWNVPASKATASVLSMSTILRLPRRDPTLTNMERVIFIDEAYLLSTGPMDEVGAEALGTLVQMLDKHKGSMAIIAAGYEDAIHERLLATNPGLSRRIPTQVIMQPLSAQYLFADVLWNAISQRTAAFGGPLQLYDDKAYDIARQFIALARRRPQIVESVDLLFAEQAAAVQDLAVVTHRIAAVDDRLRVHLRGPRCGRGRGREL